MYICNQMMAQLSTRSAMAAANFELAGRRHHDEHRLCGNRTRCRHVARATSTLSRCSLKRGEATGEGRGELGALFLFRSVANRKAGKASFTSANHGANQDAGPALNGRQRSHRGAQVTLWDALVELTGEPGERTSCGTGRSG